MTRQMTESLTGWGQCGPSREGGTQLLDEVMMCNKTIDAGKTSVLSGTATPELRKSHLAVSTVGQKSKVKLLIIPSSGIVKTAKMENN